VAVLSVLATAAIALCLGLAGAAQAAGNNPGVLPPGSTPFGKTYGEWSAAWWQWALRIPAAENPLTQDGAVDCSAEQSGRVWYLVGVISVSGTADRSCTIPPGTFLFFPVINTECSTLEAPPFHGDNPAELRECVENIQVSDIHATIDGVPVNNLNAFNVESPAFTFDVPEDNVLGVPGPDTGLSVSSGVYLMLAPLSAGEHTLHFGGTYPDFNFTLDITYHITVAR
jgi:hypothetical protein